MIFISNSKYRPYDYSYTSRQHNTPLGSSDTARIPPVAQKKHQMFGKRYFQVRYILLIFYEAYTF